MKEYKSFLISGSGRSGTRFLANLMNQSKRWIVKHEPHPKGIDKNTINDIPKIRKIFEKDYYGEVNSMRRKILLRLPIVQKGILLRNPYDVWVSIANRRFALGDNDLGKWADEFIESMTITENAIKAGIYLIHFDKLIKDINYTRNILFNFNIKDVNLTEELISVKLGATKNKIFKDFDTMPIELTKDVKDICKKIYKKYIKA